MKQALFQASVVMLGLVGMTAGFAIGSPLGLSGGVAQSQAKTRLKGASVNIPPFHSNESLLMLSGQG